MIDRPPKGIMLPFTERDPGFDPVSKEPIMRDSGEIIGGQKFFDDPEFARFMLARSSNDDEGNQVSWTVESPNPVETLNALKEFLTDGEYEEGTARLNLHGAKTEEGTALFLPSYISSQSLIGGGVVCFNGDPADVAAEVLTQPERVQAFAFGNGLIDVWWQPAWPMKFHNIRTHEVLLIETVPGSLSRLALDQCMASTASSEVRRNIDDTIDEMAQYIPTLE